MSRSQKYRITPTLKSKIEKALTDDRMKFGQISCLHDYFMISVVTYFKLVKNKQDFLMSRSQKYRITPTLKSKIEKALWFADSYGLRPTSVKLCNSDGEPASVQLCDSVPSDEIESKIHVIYCRCKDVRILCLSCT
jgi:hypothetical protein